MENRFLLYSSKSKCANCDSWYQLQKKEIGIIDKLFPTNNIENDMKRIQEQLTNISGKIEKNFNPIIY